MSIHETLVAWLVYAIGVPVYAALLIRRSSRDGEVGRLKIAEIGLYALFWYLVVPGEVIAVLANARRLRNGRKTTTTSR